MDRSSGAAVGFVTLGNFKQHATAVPLGRDGCLHRLSQDSGHWLVHSILASASIAPGRHCEIQVDSAGVVFPLGLGLLPSATVGHGFICLGYGLPYLDPQVL